MENNSGDSNFHKQIYCLPLPWPRSKDRAFNAQRDSTYRVKIVYEISFYDTTQSDYISAFRNDLSFTLQVLAISHF
jgi:hypothetical protein